MVEILLSFIIPFQSYALVFFLALIFALFLTKTVIIIAPKFGLLASSNERSSHKGKLAFGGGAPVILITLFIWIIFLKTLNLFSLAVFFATVILAIISAIDDLKFLKAQIRIIFHIAAIFICLFFLPSNINIFPIEFPLLFDRLFAGLLWLWFINLFNFMDGIDGIAASETIFICVGIFLIAIFFSFPDNMNILAIALAGSVAGFLPYNWHKAKIMLGDVGSIPIGFLLGFLLINLAINGYFTAAFILPLYFLFDASLTIIKRLFAGKKIWQAHNEHYYQRAEQAGFGHDKIVLKITLANLILVGLAIFSISQPLIAFLIALLVVATLIIHLSQLARGK